MKPTKQTVYLPVNGSKAVLRPIDLPVEKTFRTEAFVFTPEQLNQLLSDVIKNTLYQATQFVELQYECGKKSKEGCVAVFCNNCHEQVDNDSIHSTFDKTFEKYKV